MTQRMEERHLCLFFFCLRAIRPFFPLFVCFVWFAFCGGIERKKVRNGSASFVVPCGRVVGLWIVVQAREIKKKEDKSSPEPYVHTPPWFCSPLVLIFDRSWPIRRKVFAKNLLKIFLFSFDRGGTDYRKGKGECDSVRPIELMSWFQAARRRPRVCACPLSRQPAHMIFFKKIKVISYKKIRTRNNVT